MATVTFTRDDTSLKTSPLAISFSISGTAEYNVDYVIVGATSINNSVGVVTIPANQLSTTIEINSLSDSIIESDETVILTVVPVNNVYAGSDTITYTLVDDDTPLIVSVYFNPSVLITDVSLANIASNTNSVLNPQVTVSSITSVNYLNSETVLLLHFDENNGTTVIDSSNPPITGLNATYGVTNIRSKFGVSSISLTSPRDLSVPHAPKLNLLANNLQFDVWYFSSINAQVISKAFFRKTASYNFAMLAGGEIFFSLTSAGIEYTVQSSSGFALANRDAGWHHAAATRVDNTIRVFVDGVLQGTATLPSSSTSIDSNTNNGYIGFNDANGSAMNIDELRIAIGGLPYSANFTPPIAAFIN